MKRSPLSLKEIEGIAKQLALPAYPHWTWALARWQKEDRCYTCDLTKPVAEIFVRFRQDGVVSICISCLKPEIKQRKIELEAEEARQETQRMYEKLFQAKK